MNGWARGARPGGGVSGGGPLATLGSRNPPPGFARRSKVRPVFAPAVLLAAVLPAADWPQFRGPGGQGHAPAAETGLPVEWSDTENVAWAVETPPGWSSPVVVGDRICLTAAEPDGDANTLSALCLGTADGAELWRVDLFEQPGDVSTHSKNSRASPTPVFARLNDGKAAGGSLFVHFGPNATARLDAVDGRVIWERTDIGYEPVHGGGASPVLAETPTGPILFFPCDGGSDPFVVALDAATGETRWRRERPDVGASRTFSFATPLVIEVNGESQIVSPASDQVLAYRPADGSVVWRVDYSGFSVTPRPVFGRGKVFLSTSFMRPTVLAIDPVAAADGPGGATVWDLKRGGPNTPSPLLIGEKLYLVSDNGVASCVDADTGEAVWTERLGGDFSASPTFADGRIYWLGEDGVCTVTAPGRTFEKLAVNRLPGRTLASPAVSGGAVYLRTDAKLYKLAR